MYSCMQLKRFSLILAIVILPVLGNSVHATLLNVQILGRAVDTKGGSDPRPPIFKGAAAIGGEGNYWNGAVADVLGKPLLICRPWKMLAVDGKTLTGVTMKFSGFIGADHWPGSDGAPVNNALMNSYVVCRVGASVMLGGLVPNARYDLYLFGNN